MQTRVISAFMALAMLTTTLSGCMVSRRIVKHQPQTKSSSYSSSASSPSAAVSSASSAAAASSAASELLSAGEPSVSTAESMILQNSKAASGGSVAKPSTAGKSSGSGTIPLSSSYLKFNFLNSGTALFNSIKTNFWKGNMAVDTLGGNGITVWPYSTMIEAASANYLFHKDDASKAFYVSTLKNLEQFRMSRSDGYQVYSTNVGGSGDPFYDDNAWIAIEFVKAAQLLNDPSYLKDAENVVAYDYSGWDSSKWRKIKGGVFWKESYKTVKGNSGIKNTCINAPLAMVSAQLYLKTHDQTYLHWSETLYRWVRTYLCNTSNGLYYDNIDSSGTVDKQLWTYNAGCMISSGALLYQITGDTEYLKEAMQTAKSSYDGGFGQDTGAGFYQFTSLTPWFSYWLLNSYIDLYNANKAKSNTANVSLCTTYIGSFVTATARAWSLAHLSNGLVDDSWNSVTSTTPILRDESGTEQMYFVIQKWINDNHITTL